MYVKFRLDFNKRKNENVTPLTKESLVVCHHQWSAQVVRGNYAME